MGAGTDVAACDHKRAARVHQVAVVIREAAKEISGTSRIPSFGTPVPDCHVGFV
jgi:hypothetical protein